MPPSAKTRRFQDLKFRYTTDYGDNIIARQRVYKTANGASETPITPLFLTRVVDTDCPIRNPSYIEYRNVVACFANPDNDSGQSEFTVIVPFNPGDANLRAQVKQVKQFTGVQSVEYRGESITEDIETLV